MKIRIIDHGYEQHANILMESMKERIPVQISDEGMAIEFSIDSQIGNEESYQNISIMNMREMYAKMC